MVKQLNKRNEKIMKQELGQGLYIKENEPPLIIGGLLILLLDGAQCSMPHLLKVLEIATSCEERPNSGEIHDFVRKSAKKLGNSFESLKNSV